MQDTQHRRGARRGGTSGVGVGGAGEALRGLNLRCRFWHLGEPFVVEPRWSAWGQQDTRHRRGARRGGTSVGGVQGRSEGWGSMQWGARRGGFSLVGVPFVVGTVVGVVGARNGVTSVGVG